MNNKPADTRSYATKQRSEPGKGDDIPCVRCGALVLDTGLECNECGFDNYAAVTGKPFSASTESKPDCGEAGHDEGRCGNAQCFSGAKGKGK